MPHSMTPITISATSIPNSECITVEVQLAREVAALDQVRLVEPESVLALVWALALRIGLCVSSSLCFCYYSTLL